MINEFEKRPEPIEITDLAEIWRKKQKYGAGSISSSPMQKRLNWQQNKRFRCTNFAGKLNYSSKSGNQFLRLMITER